MRQELKTEILRISGRNMSAAAKEPLSGHTLRRRVRDEAILTEVISL